MVQEEEMNVLDKHTDAYWKPISGEVPDHTQTQFMLKFIRTNHFKY